ncbi:MAG: hypothetical protein KH046_00725 [Stenotrophomonas maltophilia]|uniref:DnaT-like ssDNA-binding domain-containing protein n=1 Tax=Stenotrophomonas maltophilia TaxID=40324 RepID=UPI001953CA02|nr:DnaT-like ssDNA-binding domain-containing protein [Stenotrophomonas maltophilia]MBS4799344.1 hypothetical protein [Stenotrophomonas maltophilia]
MSTDARLSTGLPGHPKTKKLVRRLGPAAGWSLVCLILWARSSRPDGDLSGMTAEDIELAADWAGENDALVRELASVGFLDGSEGGYQLHDWAEHQPWSAGAEARSEKAKWAALCRRHGRQEAALLMPEYAAKLLQAQPEQDGSLPVAGTNLPVAGSSTAPSPNPSPSPIPSPEEETPHTPQADARGADGGKSDSGKPAKAGRPKREKITFSAFVDACRAAGERPIRPDDPIFDFAEDAGIPREFVALAWREFAIRHRDSGKLQKDWRAHFRDAVRRNWFKLWWCPNGGGCELTTAGVQVKRERDAERERERQDQLALQEQAA